MNPNDFEKIYRAKRERRKQLAALPFEEKILIIEQLQELGQTMIKARETVRRSGDRLAPGH